jgi:hypothetical protein
VARDAAHQALLKRLIVAKGVSPSLVFCLDSKNSIDLTDASVSMGLVADYKVVICTLQHAEGYSLAKLGAMVTSVYPSNQAKREQMLGRIDGPAQVRTQISYCTVHCGTLTALLRHHSKAQSLQQALKSLHETQL